MVCLKVYTLLTISLQTATISVNLMYTIYTHMMPLQWLHQTAFHFQIIIIVKSFPEDGLTTFHF